MKYMDFTGAFASIWVTFVFLSGVTGPGKHVAHIGGLFMFGLAAEINSSAMWGYGISFPRWNLPISCSHFTGRFREARRHNSDSSFKGV